MLQAIMPLSSDQIVEKLARKIRGFRYQKTDYHTIDGRNLASVKVHHNGQSTMIHFRLDTTDEDLVKMVFDVKCMYHLPDQIQPSIIFDCGANIGITATFLAMQYPDAHIYCFEPLPQNLEILGLNIRDFDKRIHVMPFGLASEAGSFTYNMSANPNSFGGGTFCKISCSNEHAVQLPVRTVGDVMDELNIKQVDLFKLDTEGSEYAILQGMPVDVYRNAQALVGELHGVHDWDFCNLLDTSHKIGIDKAYHRHCYEFVAIRRDL